MPAAATSLWTTHLDRASVVPVSRQLAVALQRAIAEGGIDAGARLPSTRVLSTELGLARSTVVGVFEQLAAEGFVLSRPGSGYYVPIRPAPAPNGETPAPAPRPMSREARRLAGFVAPRRGDPRPF